MPRLRYQDLLKDPRWQRRRLERMQQADFKCECCGKGHETLNVHHLRYVAGRMPWEYEDADLSVLCESCHELQHLPKPSAADLERERQIDALQREVIGMSDPGRKRQALAEMSTLIRSRSQLAVIRLERERGLR